jgi:hypothetical protein
MLGQLIACVNNMKNTFRIKVFCYNCYNNSFLKFETGTRLKQLGLDKDNFAIRATPPGKESNNIFDHFLRCPKCKAIYLEKREN